MFGPRRLKQIAAFGTLILEILILLTGNYTFFNLLTIALCLFLLDDAFLRRLRFPAASAKVRTHTNRYVSAVLFGFIMIVSCIGLVGMFGVRTPAFFDAALAPAARFGIVNEYGLFAVMTTSRPEISIEGSNDGVDWQPYVFPYKPGPLNRAPGWVEPLQPRLDWQMWFAALGNYRENPGCCGSWSACSKALSRCSSLLEHNPFAGKPPKYIRAHDLRLSLHDFR